MNVIGNPKVNRVDLMHTIKIPITRDFLYHMFNIFHLPIYLFGRLSICGGFYGERPSPGFRLSMEGSFIIGRLKEKIEDINEKR